MIFLLLGLSLFEFIIGIIKLKKGVPYKSSRKDYFWIDSAYHRVINGSVSFNYKVIIHYPFNSFNIIETSRYETTMIYLKTGISLYFQKKEGEISFNFTYMTSHTKIENLGFILALKNIDIDNLTITVDEIDEIYEISDIITKNFSNLIAGHSYYFYMRRYSGKNLDLSLSMNYNPKKPFNYVNVNEQTDISSLWKNIKNSSNQISIKKVGDKMKYYAHILLFIGAKFVSFQIIPQYDIDNIDLKVNVGGGI